MPVTITGNYTPNEPALGEDVETDLTALATLANTLETDKLDKTGGTLSNLTITGSLTVNAVSTFTENASFQGATKIVDIAGKLKVDTIEEFTGAAGITLKHKLKVDAIDKDVDTKITINTNLNIPSVSGQLRVDKLNSVASSNIALFDDIVADSTQGIDVDTATVDNLSSNNVQIVVEKDLLGAATINADFDTGDFGQLTIATDKISNASGGNDAEIQISSGGAIKLVPHGSAAVTIDSSTSAASTVAVNRMEDLTSDNIINRNSGTSVLTLNNGATDLATLNGDLRLADIPTSNAGLITGDVYRNGAGADVALLIK